MAECNPEIVKIKCKPRNKILDGCGYVWEWLLSEAGWNNLAEDQKYGIILWDGLQPMRVFFPAVSQEHLVFIGEVEMIFDDKSKEE